MTEEAEGGEAAPAPGRHAIGTAVFAALARARGGADAVSQPRAGQLSKRMLMVGVLHRSAAGRDQAGAATGIHRRLADTWRQDREAWRQAMLHPFLGEGPARAITALTNGEPADLLPRERITADPGHWNRHRVRAVCDGHVLEVVLADRGPFRDAHGHALTGPLTPEEVREWDETPGAA